MAENNQERQKTRNELRQEIEDELRQAWEEKNGPIQVELNDEDKARKRERLESEGVKWDENRDGIEYTQAGRDFIFGIWGPSLSQQVDEVFSHRYIEHEKGGDDELKIDEEFNLAPPSDSGDEVDKIDPLELNSSDKLGLGEDLSSAELESSFLSVPGSSPDLSKELSEDVLDENASAKTPEDQERRSQMVDLEELDKRFQETHREFIGDLYKDLYKGIEEDSIARFEEEHGPIKRELNSEEKKRKKKAIEEEGGTWDEFEDGIEYTDTGKKFLFGKGPDSLESLADTEFLKDHPYYAEDLKSWKKTRASLEERENTEESEQESGADETQLNAGETLIEKVKEKRERDPDLPKSKKLAETLENLDDQGKIEFLQKFRGIKASVLVEGENGARERQYIRLKDGEEFNLNGKEELTFEFFDKYGDIVLNEDGVPKTKTQKISDIKYRDWKPYDFYHIKKEQHHYNDVLEKINDDDFDYANSAVYENEVSDKNIRAMRRLTESRGYTEQEAEEWKRLLSQHESLLKELENSYSLARDNFKEVKNEKHATFFEERLKEIVNYKKSEIVEAIKAGDVNLNVISREITALKSLLETYKKTEEKFDFRVAEKVVENNDAAVQETKNVEAVETEKSIEESVEAIEEEISRLIDGDKKLSPKQKLELKNNETILVSSWPATIEMNRYQVATCIYQGVDVTTVKVKGLIPLFSQTIIFSLTNGAKQELNWHDFFNTIDANYRDNLLPAIREHVKNKTAKNNSSTEVPKEEVFEMESSEGVNSPTNPGAEEGSETAGNPEESDREDVHNIENSKKPISEDDKEKKDEKFENQKKVEDRQGQGDKPREKSESLDGQDLDEDAQSGELEKLDKVKKEAIDYVTREDILNILLDSVNQIDLFVEGHNFFVPRDIDYLSDVLQFKINKMKAVKEIKDYIFSLENIVTPNQNRESGKSLEGNQKEKELKELKLKIKTFLLFQSKKKLAGIERFRERSEAQEGEDKFIKETFEDIDKQTDMALLQDMYESITSK